MSHEFKELDCQETAIGDISLRRRAEPRLDGKILYEVKLGSEWLMSSLFTEAETQLAILGLAKFANTELDVIVGGLGLGYTAAAALQNPAVKSLKVIELLAPVIDWHQRELVPLGAQLIADSRCDLVQADFFAVASAPSASFDGIGASQGVHAVLLDIDHTPKHWLNPDNSTFYTTQSLLNLAQKIHPGGVFGLWSDDPPDSEFTQLLASVFESCEPHTVSFPNPYTGGQSSSTVYIAHKASV